MADDNSKQDQKKGIPGGFFVFLLLAVLIALTVQNFLETKSAKVAFSYEVQHLVNLQLIQPQDSKMIALNDHLVTFSGKFRDHPTEEGKKRYKYLQLLAGNHDLTEEKEDVAQQLRQERQDILSAADWFLHLSGLSIPADGYRILSSSWSALDIDAPLVVHQLSDKEVVSLPSLQNAYASLKSSPNEKNIAQFGASLAILIQNFRSPVLGIGIEGLKQQLRSLDKEVLEVNALPQDSTKALATYGQVLTALSSIVDELNQLDQGARLTQTRAVRSYKISLSQYDEVVSRLADNETQLAKAKEAVADVTWFFNDQELSTRALEKQDPEIFNQWFHQAQDEWDNFPLNHGLPFRALDQPRTLALERTFTTESAAPNYLSYLFTLLPVLLVILLLYFVFARQMKGVGGGALNFGKAPAKLLGKGMTNVTFKDVAGCDEAKDELQEIIEFLKDPTRFTALGGRIPKGVLLIGSPGTGKTLIAKAVAGEANRPFFSISGSDFVEMFVGVGASRIRDLFDQAKKNAPCIIFMDEIDAVGRHRGAGIGGGHDEREQTLNQLLVEMDGFDTNEGVILIAATNRPDVLDKALLRPGRFDRRVVIDLPDIKGRFEILKVHARKLKIDASVELMALARATPGASGADLSNMMNEAALLSARKGRSAVTAPDLLEACDKVRYGKERRSLDLDAIEKKTTAYHESGHALVGLVVKHADPVDKVTIIPRGLSLGATHFLPKKNRVTYWKQELVDQLAVAMGGRVAEELFVGDISSGAKQDIAQATSLARSMVCEWGMSDSLGLVAYDERSEAGQYLGMPNYREKFYSEDTAKAIDDEVRKIIDAAYKRAKQICEDQRDKIELMTAMLMEFETLDAEDIGKIMSGEWDTEGKKRKMKAEDNLFKKPEPVPPPPPSQADGPILEPSG